MMAVHARLCRSRKSGWLPTVACVVLLSALLALPVRAGTPAGGPDPCQRKEGEK